MWHADTRQLAGIPGGRGGNLSFSQLYRKHWTTFVRGGLAKDNGAILSKTLSAGFGWSRVPGGNQLGVGYNWGEPMDSTWGPDLPNQHTVEVFYRIQLWEELALTPDIQYARNPALNEDHDRLWIVGLRARLEL